MIAHRKNKVELGAPLVTIQEKLMRIMNEINEHTNLVLLRLMFKIKKIKKLLRCEFFGLLTNVLTFLQFSFKF